MHIKIQRPILIISKIIIHVPNWGRVGVGRALGAMQAPCMPIDRCSERD
jgi:hypothetical protein